MHDCFIICPIGAVASETRSRSDKLMRHVFEPILEEKGYRAVRADKIPKAGLITSQIINLVIESPLVIADLTESNPNVFYELAIRHVTGRPFVHVIHKGSSIPFDIAGVRTIEIDLGDPDSLVAAKNELSAQIDEFKRGHKADSPVTVAASVRALQADSGLAEDLINKIDSLVGFGLTSIDDIDDKLDRAISILEQIEGRIE